MNLHFSDRCTVFFFYFCQITSWPSKWIGLFEIQLNHTPQIRTIREAMDLRDSFPLELSVKYKMQHKIQHNL